MARLDLLNARVRGRRDGALGREGLLALLAEPTLPARLAALARSGWWRGAGAEVVAPGAPAARERDRLAAVERAIRQAERAEAAWVLGAAEGPRPRALLAAWLGLAEAEAVKVLLRGAAAAVPVELVLAAAVATPGLPDPLLAAAAGAGSPEGALAVLAAAGQPLAVALATRLAAVPAGPLAGAGAGPRAAAARRATAPRPPSPRRASRPGAAPAPPSAHGLAALEAAVDSVAQERLEAACAGGGEDAALLRGFSAGRVDARNAASLLALAGGGGVVPFLPGGRLGPLVLDGLARLDAARLAEALEAALPGLGAALSTPWGVELGLLARELASARLAARALPLSIAVPVAHLLERRLEAQRLCAVLRGASLGVAADELFALVEAA